MVALVHSKSKDMERMVEWRCCTVGLLQDKPMSFVVVSYPMSYADNEAATPSPDSEILSE